MFSLFFKAGGKDYGETLRICQGREHARLALLSFLEMKQVCTLPGHNGKSRWGTASPQFVLARLCWEGEVLCQEKSPTNRVLQCCALAQVTTSNNSTSCSQSQVTLSH